MKHQDPRCTCFDTFGEHIIMDSCPLHGSDAGADMDAVDICFAGMPRVAELFGPKPAITVTSSPGRIIDGGTVLLRPYEPKAPRCGCDLPSLYGHDTGCELHPGPVLSDPIQLLLAATQLISDQPTTEQWKTITKAIQALVPSPFGS